MIKKNTVLLKFDHETQGQFFYFLEELTKQFPELNIYLVTSSTQRRAQPSLHDTGSAKFNTVSSNAIKYLKLLATAEYILTNSALDPFFIKRNHQKCIHLSCESSMIPQDNKSNLTDVANLQRNFYQMDKIIVDSEAHAYQLADKYSLRNIYQGDVAVCPFSNHSGAKVISPYIFQNKLDALIKEIKLSNNKETALVLGGGFWDNGVTTALLNTFNNIDLDKRNYVVLLGEKQLKKEYEFRIRNLPQSITFYPFPEQVTAGVFDRFLYLAYMKFEWFDSKWVRKKVAEVVKNDYRRITGNLKIDHIIHFTGFGNRYSELVKHAPSEVNTVMYVHTDMFAEYEAKKNFSKKITFSTYERVSKVAVVHENLKTALIKELPFIRDKLYVMNNFLGEERTRELGSADLLSTLVAVEMEFGDKSRLISDLDNESISIFINIGRFDYQKGHDRLIEAFEMVYQKDSRVRLVIIAPHGPLRDQTLATVANSSASNGIYILGRMSNPYALLAKCDCFVLSSYYEGLGLVVYEALAVGISVVTVDLKETIGYLQNNEAIIVNGATEELAEGMQKYLNAHRSNAFDFSIPKVQSKVEFEALLSKD